MKKGEAEKRPPLFAFMDANAARTRSAKPLAGRAECLPWK